MICHTAQPSAATGHQTGLVDQMHVLRARQFFDRRGWNVEVRGGRETDGFDLLDPIYILVASEAGRLLASLRILPTSGPHMLADVFPEVMGGQDPIRSPSVWESSRF